jgi:hypothetical protein
MSWAAALVAGSVRGVTGCAWLASRGVLLPAPLLHQVYARAAGEHGVGLWSLVGWTLLERGLRICLLGLVIWGLAGTLHPWLRRLYGAYLLAVGIVFALALNALVATWS